MTNLLIEHQPGPPLTLAISPLGGGAGNRPTLLFATQTSIKTYLREKMSVSDKNIQQILEKRAVPLPLSDSAIQQFWKDLSAQQETPT